MVSALEQASAASGVSHNASVLSCRVELASNFRKRQVLECIIVIFFPAFLFDSREQPSRLAAT